ncbi:MULTISPECIES: hypothetical protein [unclassified Burkholderia]|uniref:hypothetical protein n=1 Tax=unclassified Burkholderia TaxID=2613784 RepID=UPI000F56955A|nr:MULTISPECIES: hypothetical protein [unclassified Burkholderia]
MDGLLPGARSRVTVECAGRKTRPLPRFRMHRSNAMASAVSARGQATTRRNPFESRRAARITLDRLPAGHVDRLAGDRRYPNAEWK